MDVSDYVDEANRQLQDTQYYRKLNYDPSARSNFEGVSGSEDKGGTTVSNSLILLGWVTKVSKERRQKIGWVTTIFDLLCY